MAAEKSLPVQLYGTSSLCFDKDDFMKDDFSVDNFVRVHQAAGSGGLESLRDDLGVYLKILRNAMIELINRDYADFVNLSTNLTGLDRLIEALKTPLGQLREEVLINEKLFYGEPSNTRSKYVCILKDSDSESEVDDPELLNNGDEYFPPDAEVSSDEEEERPAKKQKLVKKKKGIMIEEYPDEEHIYDGLALQGEPQWSQVDLQNDPLPVYEYEKPLEIRSPYEYFCDFFTSDMVDNIAYQTNLYTKQKSIINNFATDSEEIMRFIGVLLLMGIAPLPAIKDYWTSTFRMLQVAEVMGSKRFRLLRRTIHFNDNTQKDNDRFHKIRPLYTALTNACLKVPATPKQSIDEVMVAFQGKNHWKPKAVH
nr:uncharacterized protein LOC128690109 [Cherax quadricarinatus]